MSPVSTQKTQRVGTIRLARRLFNDYFRELERRAMILLLVSRFARKVNSFTVVLDTHFQFTTLRTRKLLGILRLLCFG